MTASSLVALTLALLALLLTALSLNISRLRIRHRISFGDGGHKDLLLAVRAHGNCLEQSALFALLALALAALVPPSITGLAACCLLFGLARLLHAWALFQRQLPVRQVAHGASVLAQLGLVGLILHLLLTR